LSNYLLFTVESAYMWAAEKCGKRSSRPWSAE